MSTESRKKGLSIRFLNIKTWEEGNLIVAGGSCLIRAKLGSEKLDTQQIGIDIPIKENAARISFGSRYGTRLPGGLSFNTFRIEFNREEAKTFDIQNKLIVTYRGERIGRLYYSAADRKKGKNRNSSIFVHDGTTCTSGRT